MGQQIELEAGKVTRVGRTNKAEVATQDGYMSGIHFAIECEPDVCRLRDLNSRNGTSVNGEKVTAIDLRDGDRIFAGQSNFVIHIESEAPATAVEKSSANLMDTIRPASPPQPPTPPQKSIAPPALPDPTKMRAGSTAPHAPSEPLPSSPAASSTPGAQADADRKEKPEHADRREKPEEASQTDQLFKESSPVAVAATPNIGLLSIIETAAAAATPEGRLLQILRRQRDPLYALLDAARDTQVLALLRGSSEEFQSLYDGERFAEIAPYLVLLPPQSQLPEKLIREGWGKGWGVYLTCGASLREIRAYFRKVLMVKTPDGGEFFSRFYDPRFLREFLRTGTPAEAERMFGPISRYFIEAEKPEILMQFTRTKQGAELKERLLLLPGT